MVLGIFLAISSVIDIWKKKVYLIPTAAAGLIGIVVQIVNHPLSWKVCIGGIVIGCCFMLAAKVTRESIGYGDGAAVMVIGVWMGVFQTVEILLMALTMAAIFSIALLLFRRVGRKYAIPFIPFLFAANCLTQLING